MFSFFKEFFNSENYIMQPEPPPIKWIIDIVPGKLFAGSGVEEYVVKRLDPKQNFVHYEIIAFFKTIEEAEAFVEKHFHFPVGYRSPPPAFPEPEVAP